MIRNNKKTRKKPSKLELHCIQTLIQKRGSLCRNLQRLFKRKKKYLKLN